MYFEIEDKVPWSAFCCLKILNSTLWIMCLNHYKEQLLPDSVYLKLRLLLQFIHMAQLFSTANYF